MLFLYRPRQTWMPFGPPRRRMNQDQYNLRTQQAYDATLRVNPPPPAASPPRSDLVSRLQDLAALHQSGALTDAEFAAAKAKLIGTEESSA